MSAATTERFPWTSNEDRLKMLRQTHTLFSTIKMFRAAASPANVQFAAPIRNLTTTAIRASSSKAPSSTNPDNLPQLPVPDLKDTLQKYLRSVRPLLNNEAYAATECVVKDFAANDGAKLHELLCKRASTTENWLSDWWLQYAYLGFRSPVTVYSNPGLYYNVKPFSSQSAWLSHTARTIFATMNYKRQIDNKEIPAERMGKALLDMAQYGRIFGTCRIPAAEFDKIEFHPTSKYIVVAYRNGFYKLPVYTSDGCMLEEEDILALLEKVIDLDKNAENPPIGALTAQHRDELARAYSDLIKDPQNKESVTTIQQALFIVCLDSAVPLTMDKQDHYNEGSHQLIHGGGSTQNSANRWFDKTLQLIVNENGLSGLNYEHSPGEGQPIAVLSDAIMNYTKKTGDIHGSTNLAVEVTKLAFKVDATLKGFLDSALKNVDALASNLEMHVLDFTDYGKNFIKSQKMSPDSYIQIAMQYAFFMKHGEPGAHYESAHHRMFIHGRTETIRSCSVESIAFARSMCNTKMTDAERVKALQAAVNGHKDYTMQAITGKGVDRLLFGLKLIAREKGESLPSFYEDEGFTKSTHFRISTSQVASVHKAFMCYGPSVDDGYGICYNPRDNDILLAVSAFSCCRETSAVEMSATLKEALNNMFGLLVRAGIPITSKL